MKKYCFDNPNFLLVIISLFLLFQKSQCQSEYLGAWEGFFMDNFRTVIIFEEAEGGQFIGSIKMFNIDKIIQDDKITEIEFKDDVCKFYIPEKETSYKGIIINEKTEISGEFTFPDGGTHTLNLKKQTGLVKKPIERYREMKEKKYSISALNEDLSFLYSTLKEHHPQLYAHSSEEDMNRLFEKLSGKIATELAIEDFYVLAAQLTDAVKCSHTGIRMPTNYQKLVKDFGNYFPLNLYFTESKAYYLSGLNSSSMQIEPGNEIVSINDIPVPEIISHMFNFIPSEGSNLTTEYNELNNSFNSLFYHLDDSDEFEIIFKKRNSIENLIVKACNYSGLDKKMAFIESEKSVFYDYLNDRSLGIISIPSFGIRNMENYLQQLDSIFSDLGKKNTKNLILDLRDNRGGHPIFAAQILSYLIDHDFTYFKSNDDIADFEPLYNPMTPNELNFKGRVFVFVNGGCLSTTGHLISLLKYHSDAVFIGEEPGSTFQCNDFSVQQKLPNTGIELNVPRTTFITAVSDNELNSSFPINYLANYSVNDVINNRDVYLDTVLSLIKGQEKNEPKEQ
jgi:hypothetical protein